MGQADRLRRHSRARTSGAAPGRGGTARSKTLTAAVVAVTVLMSAACVPGSEEDTAPQEGSSVDVGSDRSFYSYNDDTRTGDATANSDVLYLMNSGFNHYGPDLELVRDESFGTYEKLSDDPLTVRYTVNEGVSWSDGTPVDAADLLLQWAALSGALNTVTTDDVERDPETGALSRTARGQVYFDGRPSGLAQVSRTPKVGAGDRSVTLVYDEPYADWELAFDVGVPAHATAMKALDIDDPEEAKNALVRAIQDEDVDDLSEIADFWNTGFEYDSYPEDELLRLSNGAYVMRAFEKDLYMALQTSPTYDGDHRARVERVTIHWDEDPFASVQALRDGTLDLVATPAAPDVLQALRDVEGVTVEPGMAPTYEHLDLTHDNGGPFDARSYGGDEETARQVRRAFLATVPRQAIVDRVVRPLQSDAEVRSSQTLVPGAPGYDLMVRENGSDAFDQVDLEAARSLLEDAGVRTPVEVRFLFDADDPRRQEAFELVRRSAGKAGFDVVDDGDADWGLLLGSGTYDAVEYAWPSTSTAVLGSQERFRSSGQDNHSGFTSSRVDRLYDELATTTDPERRLQLLVAVEQQLWADGFGVTLYQHPGLVAHSDGISNVRPIAVPPTFLYGFWEWRAGREQR